MKLLLLTLVFSVSTAILLRPTPNFDVEALRAVDPRHNAMVEWMFTRRRRFSPCLLCKTGGRPARHGGYRYMFMARSARNPGVEN